MTCDERLEKLLNKAGQTISDLPKPSDYCFAYDVNNPEISDLVENTVREFCQLEEDCGTGIRAYHDYILNLTDVIDRLEWALENLLNLKDRHVHIVSNVDAPEGMAQEQYFTAVEAIIDATNKYRAGLEPWDDWRADDV